MLAVPNFSAGRDREAIAALETALSAHARVLDVHSDATHDRSVFTLWAEPQGLVDALAAGAKAAAGAIDMSSYDGAHPAVGALDVAPLVWLDGPELDAASAAARSAAAAIAGEGIPVFFYGALATSEERRERAYFRRGGLEELSRRMAAGELEADLGPQAPHAAAGATLVTARRPLAAFNLVLAGIDLAGAAAIAARLRESGGGLEGVRAIAVDLAGDAVQVSTNVHNPIMMPLVRVVELARSLAGEAGGELVSAEIVGLIPAVALIGFPEDVPIEGFDPARHVIENRLVA